tara:strand:+ start:769 stop:1191 length:423 start_codon:yes stop_codon:yes gene_type:complete
MAKKEKAKTEVVAKKLQAEFDLSSSKSRKIVSMVSSQMTIKSGPFPSPEDYEQYQEIDPGLTDQMKEMARKEQDHQHRMDKLLLEKEFTLMSRGQILAFLVFSLVVGLGAFSIYLGFEWGGAIITALGVTGIITQFLKKR